MHLPVPLDYIVLKENTSVLSLLTLSTKHNEQYLASIQHMFNEWINEQMTEWTKEFMEKIKISQTGQCMQCQHSAGWGRIESLRPAWATYWALSQSGLNSETLSQKTESKEAKIKIEEITEDNIEEG
jgi:hypothetical protein